MRRAYQIEVSELQWWDLFCSHDGGKVLSKLIVKGSQPI